MEINVCLFSKVVSSIVLGNKLVTNFFNKTLKNEVCYVNNIQGVQDTFQKSPVTDTFVLIIHIVLSSYREEIRDLCLLHPVCFFEVQNTFVIVFVGQEMKANVLCVLKCHQQQLPPLPARCAHPQFNPDFVLSSFHFYRLYCTFGENSVVAALRCVAQMEEMSADDVRVAILQERPVITIQII